MPTSPACRRSVVLLPVAGFVTFVAVSLVATGASSPQQGGFRFRTGVELINVSATVIDDSGRFVSGLGKEDFAIYEDGRPQQITHFSNERVPVSLGIALDTSGSMEGEKIKDARAALDRFLYDLLDPSDEIFVYRFDNEPELIEDWTTDRGAIRRALGRIAPRGGTALYDAVAEAVPRAQAGHLRKKALVVISDGNDTSSRTEVSTLRQMIRQTEVLVYAVGIDGHGTPTLRWPGSSFPPRRPPRIPIPSPFPLPGGRRPPQPPPFPPTPPTGGAPSGGGEERVNVAALRSFTDDSGGRTEIIRTAADLDPATASIADELSRQYFLGYETNSVRDGRWHSIRVEVLRGHYRVRARRGYVATP
jgi:Ca-activated chloride channel family protein